MPRFQLIALCIGQVFLNLLVLLILRIFIVVIPVIVVIVIDDAMGVRAAVPAARIAAASLDLNRGHEGVVVVIIVNDHDIVKSHNRGRFGGCRR